MATLTDGESLFVEGMEWIDLAGQPLVKEENPWHDDELFHVLLEPRSNELNHSAIIWPCNVKI